MVFGKRLQIECYSNGRPQRLQSESFRSDRTGPSSRSKGLAGGCGRTLDQEIDFPFRAHPWARIPPILNGFEFKGRGDKWPLYGNASRLSPDASWLILQSVKGTQRPRTQVVVTREVSFDSFNAETGKKVFTIRGTYSGIGDDPDLCLARTACLTERYLFFR